jgi:ATP-dependent RNA helicase RhlE
VLLPTRELALQVEDSLKKVGTPLGLKTASFIGGEAMERQLYALRKNPHVIIATPGRLNDYLNRNILKLDDIKVLVLDEADMMFDMGFAPQVEEILARIKNEHQTMLFSATMPTSIVKLAAKHMKMPVSVEVAPPGTSAEKIDQEMYILHKDDRSKQLLKILEDYKGSVLIFVRTKFGVKGLTEHLNSLGHKAEEIHSNLSLSQRRRSLENFKTGRSRILVATDIAARGLDVSGIELVVNYHLPDKLSDYVHRIGRTARAGKEGKAISFATADQARDIRDIETLINRQIPMTEFVELKRVGVGRSTGNSRARRAPRIPNGVRRFEGGRSTVKSFDRDSKAPFKKENKSFSRDAQAPFKKEDKSFGYEDRSFRDKPGAGLESRHTSDRKFTPRFKDSRPQSFSKRGGETPANFRGKRPSSFSVEQPDRRASVVKPKGKSDFNFIEDMPVARKKAYTYDSANSSSSARPFKKFSGAGRGDKAKAGKPFSSSKRSNFKKF